MRINCPLCGLRDLEEFTYDGDAKQAARRPMNGSMDVAKQKPSGKDLVAWVDYVYLRENPCGNHHEIWQHSAGCKQFFEVVRDTKTHKISSEKLYDNALAKSKSKKNKENS